MYAIVDIAGQQFKVEKSKRVYVHRLEANEGDKIEFSNVLLLEKDGKISVGTPTLDGVRVAAKVLAHLKGDKVHVFKKKRRKGYAKFNGHRQYLSEILVQAILAKGETLKAADDIDFKRTIKTATPAKATKAEKEASAPKKAAAKKPAAKKAAAKKPAAKKAAKKKTE